MTRIPDIVRDFELETRFLPDCSDTIHTYHESDLASGRRLVVREEHWRRQREIGSGTYGNVWLERCIKGGRFGVKVRAVKQLPTAYSDIDYHRELEAITRFSHPKYERCFTTSLGWFKSPAYLFIAMEYLEHGDLLVYLNNRPPLPETEAKVIAFQILEGLTMMHGNEFVHGDLKPNNILIKSHPPNMWWVKLSDFGLSKRVEEASGAPTLKGTAGYIAPELYKFTERGTAYAPDIWAVGAILFFMLLKRPVFEALGHLFEYVKNEDFPTQPLADVGTTDLSIELIFSLMRASPNDRPSAKMAILHECVRPIYDHLSSWQMPDSTQPSPPSPIEPMTEGFESEFGSWDIEPLLTLGDPPIEPMAEEFESEFGSWDTKPLLTLGDPLHQEPNDQPSALPTESLDVAVHRQIISACGGVVRPINKLIHRGFAGKISFSADSRVLAMAGNKEIIRLWNTSSYSQLPGLKGKLCIAFSPDGKLIASCGIFTYMQLWDAVTLAEVGHTNLSDYPHTVMFSPDSSMIAYAINHKVVVQEVSGGSKRRMANCNFGFRDKDSPSYLSFSPDSKSVWFACLNKYQMLDIEQDLAGRTFKLPVLSKTIGLSLDGKYLAYLDNAKKAHVRLLELSTRDVVLKIETGIQNLTGLAFSPNSKLLAVSLGQSFSLGNLSLWDIETAKKLSEIVPNDRIRSMAFSPDGTMLASTNSNGSTTLWGADTRDQHED